MIRLYQFPAMWNLPNVSPFCMKLETYLRMAKLPFEIIKLADPRRTPKKKLPFINDDGFILADTSLIIEYLQKKYGNTLDANLTELQKAQALALQRLMEEHLYWVLVYTRWVKPANWERVKQDFFAKSPWFVRVFISEILRKQTQKTLYAQGIGRHTAEEIEALGVQDLQALSVVLGQNDFFMGSEPTSIDACAYAFIANILFAPIHSTLSEYAKSQQNFVDYCARMKSRFYL